MAGMQATAFEKQQPDAEPKFDTEQQKAAYWIKHFLEKGDMSANEIYCRLDNEGISKRVARMVKRKWESTATRRSGDGIGVFSRKKVL